MDFSAVPGAVTVVDNVYTAFADIVRERVRSSLAISGGSTARRCYEQLAVTPGIAWSDIDVFVSDERWVPVSDADSNEGMARIACFDSLHPRAWYSMRNAAGRDATIDQAAAAYDKLIETHTAIDVVHLGFGADGHTASLFPGSPALDEKTRLVVATGDEVHPWPRISMTFPGIARASTVVVTVAGNEKRDAFTQLCAGAPFPAARLAARDEVVWLVEGTIVA